MPIIFITRICTIIYKCQGGEIDNDYNMHDNKTDKKTALYNIEQDNKIEYIHLDENMLLKSYYNRKLPELELINTKW